MINRIKYLSILVCVFLIRDLFAQQLPQYTQYNYNMNLVNPAYTGSISALKVNMMGRSQWNGVEGAPTTGTLVVDTALKNNIGLGFSAIYDQLGPVKQTHIYGDVSYGIRVSDEGRLAFGLKGGISFQNVNTNLLQFSIPESVVNGINDKPSPNFGIGMYYHEDEFYLGLSIPNLLPNSFSQITNVSVNNIENETNIYLSGGYLFEVNGSRDFIFKPSILVRYSTLFPVITDISASVFLNQKIELGISYRTNQTISLTSLFRLGDNMRVGYAYDYNSGELSAINNGSHEILLLFNFRNEHRRRKGKYNRFMCF
ncbi:PorP/SprF family type IX secretion system membrane protein [Tenacibaculum agarivorans]|uniref:PorP/SprF family type IX secretion system membrane protein n=1 Tax=Tenacibaculum agarivorans TaxID=1908389 RepID=UPI00094B7DB2|nr:type IX secretion system membrane protein PorP/SprF [Tenacibaculum agarivorans]